MVYRRSQRSERVRAEARDKILRAAAKLFVRHGYEATTMQDIVKAARTSIGNVYFYFENKEALAATLLEEAATAAWEWTDRAVVSVAPGPARLAVMVMANTTAMLGANAGLTRILLLGATTTNLREHVARRFGTRIKAYILENVPSFPADRIDLAVTAWLGAGRNFLEQKLAGRLADEPQALAEFLVRWNLRGVGVPEGEIDAAIAVAARVVADWNGKQGGGPKAPHLATTSRP